MDYDYDDDDDDDGCSGLAYWKWMVVIESMWCQMVHRSCLHRICACMRHLRFTYITKHDNDDSTDDDGYRDEH